jgi:hypothetical protein
MVSFLMTSTKDLEKITLGSILCWRIFTSIKPDICLHFRRKAYIDPFANITSPGKIA